MSIRAAYAAGHAAAFKKFGWNMPPQVMAALQSPHLRAALPGMAVGGIGGALHGAMTAPEGERMSGALTHGLVGAAGGGLATAGVTHALGRNQSLDYPHDPHWPGRIYAPTDPRYGMGP